MWGLNEVMHANCSAQSLAKVTSYRTIKLLSTHLEWELSHSLFHLKISSPGKRFRIEGQNCCWGKGAGCVCGWVGGWGLGELGSLRRRGGAQRRAPWGAGTVRCPSWAGGGVVAVCTAVLAKLRVVAAVESAPWGPGTWTCSSRSSLSCSSASPASAFPGWLKPVSGAWLLPPFFRFWGFRAPRWLERPCWRKVGRCGNMMAVSRSRIRVFQMWPPHPATTTPLNGQRLNCKERPWLTGWSWPLRGARANGRSAGFPGPLTSAGCFPHRGSRAPSVPCIPHSSSFFSPSFFFFF